MQRIDDLQRGGLRIIQDDKGFRFGTDAVLLADFAAIKPGERVCDMGTGTGVLPLLLSARAEGTTFDAFEIQPDVGNVVEIMKNRDLGVVDEMIKLYFDRRSRTMSDVKGLPPQHAWSEKIEQMLMEGFTRVNQGEPPMEWR